MATIAILQPYVPRYRVPLFDELRRALAEDGHELQLITGTPDATQRQRNDAAPLQPGQIVVPSRCIRIGGVTASWKPVTQHLGTADLVIAQMGAGVLETSYLLARARRKVALWGHGYAATGNSGRLDAVLERWQLRRTIHFFAYTDRGGVAARAAGVDEHRITVLQNTVDTEALRNARARLGTDADEALRKELRLGSGPVCAYIGGLDGSKRIDFLLRAADLLAQRIDGFRLMIAGDGVLRSEVEAAASADAHVVYVGIADDELKARISCVTSALLNPGRVGLVAVDSFALELPIITTDWTSHAPEFEYLRHDVNAVVTADDVESFVDATSALLNDKDRLARLRSGCAASSIEYSIPAMVDRFSDGIRLALNAGVSDLTEKS